MGLTARWISLAGGALVIAGFVVASGEGKTLGIVLIAVGLLVEAAVAIPRLVAVLKDPRTLLSRYQRPR